jgi:hypothetical protein
MQPAGHEANGFDRWYLHEWEACVLYQAWYMAPQDFRLPGTWRLSTARSAAIHQHYFEGLTLEERKRPRLGP